MNVGQISMLCYKNAVFSHVMGRLQGEYHTLFALSLLLSVDNGHFDISDGCTFVPDKLLNYEVNIQE